MPTKNFQQKLCLTLLEPTKCSTTDDTNVFQQYAY